MVVKDKGYIIIFAICIITTFIFITGLFLKTIEINPIKLKVDLNNEIFTFVPQGWAFFTRNPREAQIVIYKKNYKNEFKQINQRHSSYLNLFGLNRRAAKMILEVASIKNNLNDNLYYNTEWNYQADLHYKIPKEIIKIKNQIQYPILKGEYIIIYQKPVPWAWSKSLEKIKMPAKIIRLKID